MVNGCEASAAEPRGELLAGWHAAKQIQGLKRGNIGRPDDWLGSHVRSINPGFRFSFERVEG